MQSSRDLFHDTVVEVLNSPVSATFAGGWPRNDSILSLDVTGQGMSRRREEAGGGHRVMPDSESVSVSPFATEEDLNIPGRRSIESIRSSDLFHKLEAEEVEPDAQEPLKKTALLGSVSAEVCPSATKTVRAEALARYRMKKARRSFVKRVRYETRRNMATQRPRLRGRFVKKGSQEFDNPGVQVSSMEATLSESLRDGLFGPLSVFDRLEMHLR